LLERQGAQGFLDKVRAHGRLSLGRSKRSFSVA
jgi:hypothetical protein